MQKLDERYASMKHLTPPDYLVEANLMAADAKERENQKGRIAAISRAPAGLRIHRR